MNPKITIKYACAFYLLSHAVMQAHAEEAPWPQESDKVLPAVCYTSADGPEWHQKTIDLVYDVNRNLESAAKVHLTRRKYEIKKIQLKWTQTQATDTSPIKLDASGSTVPSGQIEYLWNANHTDPVLMTDDGNPGSYRLMTLTIRDKVCDMEEVVGVRVTSK